MRAPAVRFRIDFSNCAHVGPGKIELLEAIARYGSLSQAARTLGMSYRRAWLLVASLNESFRKPVTVASTGGKGGGGAAVTEFGAELIESYRALEKDFAALAARRLGAIVPAVVPDAKSPTKATRRHLTPSGAV